MGLGRLEVTSTHRSQTMSSGFSFGAPSGAAPAFSFGAPASTAPSSAPSSAPSAAPSSAPSSAAPERTAVAEHYNRRAATSPLAARRESPIVHLRNLNNRIKSVLLS